MTFLPSLPLEVQQSVIDILGEDADHESLKACSLVCWAFVTTARRAIFASGNLTLNDQGIDGVAMTSFAFERLTVRNPELPTLIRSLHYCPGVLDHQNPTFLSSLTSMNSLKSLAIVRDQRFTSMPPETYSTFYWSNNPLRRALLHLVHLPCLHTFKIDHVHNFFPSDLAPCASLRYLIIECCQLDPHTSLVTSFSDDLPLQTVRLRGLSCLYNSASIAHEIATLRSPMGRPLVDLESLTRLNLAVTTFAVYQTAQTLLARCTRLEEVELFVSDFAEFDPSVAILLRPAMKSLKQIHLDLSVNDQNPDPLFDLPSLLQDMRASNVLESLGIYLSIETAVADGTGHTWSSLDLALSGDVWSLLRQVTLEIEVIGLDEDFDSSTSKDALEHLPETLLTRLAANKSIDFDFNVDFDN